MNRRRWILVFLLILLAAAITLDVLWRHHDAGISDHDVLLNPLPLDANAVFFADFTAFRQSPFAAAFYNWLPKLPTDPEYLQFLRDTGFDYERDLQRLAFASIPAPQSSSLFAIAEGRFDRKKISAFVSRAGTRESGSGREIFSIPLNDDSRRISFTFLADSKIALSDSPDLPALLAAPRSAADAREWQSRFTRLAGSSLFAVLRQSASTASLLSSQTPGGFQSPQLSALLSQLQWITIAGKPQDNSLRIVIEGECSNDQTVRQLSDLLHGMLLLAQSGLNGPDTRRQLDPRVRDAYLDLIKGAEVSRLDRGDLSKSVRLVFDISPQFLEATRLALPNQTAPAPSPATNAKSPQPRHRKTGRN